MLELNHRGRRMQPHSGGTVFLTKMIPACPKMGRGQHGFREKTHMRNYILGKAEVCKRDQDTCWTQEACFLGGNHMEFN